MSHLRYKINMCSSRLFIIIVFVIFGVYHPVTVSGGFRDLQEGSCNGYLAQFFFDGNYQHDITHKPTQPNNIYVRVYLLFLRDLKLYGELGIKRVEEDGPDFNLVTEDTYNVKTEFCSKYYSPFKIKIRGFFDLYPIELPSEVKDVIELADAVRDTVRAIVEGSILHGIECIRHLTVENGYTGDLIPDIERTPKHPANIYVRSYQKYFLAMKIFYGASFGREKVDKSWYQHRDDFCRTDLQKYSQEVMEEDRQRIETIKAEMKKRKEKEEREAKNKANENEQIMRKAEKVREEQRKAEKEREAQRKAENGETGSETQDTKDTTKIETVNNETIKIEDIVLTFEAKNVHELYDDYEEKKNKEKAEKDEEEKHKADEEREKQRKAEEESEAQRKAKEVLDREAQCKAKDDEEKRKADRERESQCNKAKDNSNLKEREVEDTSKIGCCAALFKAISRRRSKNGSQKPGK